MAADELGDKSGEKETAARKDAGVKRAAKPPPKPQNNFAGKGGKNPKPAAGKGRMFRHQGR